ncbi:MAG: ribosomal protein S12 methylthiotransferase RimO [Phycisphaeraceae bacterium]|nr:MAG: ribosomal protein S12 methylthiotransferase RimO [Phycisphaeraceae bacterium]
MDQTLDQPATGPDTGEIQTVSLVSLGCPKNLVDSEKMLGLLAEAGLVPVSAEAMDDCEHDDLSVAGSEQDASATAGRVTPADAIIINTCGFLEASKEESLGVIHDALAAKARGEAKRVVVAGCLVQRHRAKILEWAPGVDAMIGVFDRDHVVEAVAGPKADRSDVAADAPPYWIASNALLKARELGKDTVGLTVNGKDGKGIGYFESDSARLRLTPRHYAYLRIGEGCNQNCAFCTIPSIRGKMRSKPVDQAASEARELIRDGAHELLLIGQDTTSYGDDLGIGMTQGASDGLFGAGLPKLLRSVTDAVRAEGGAGWVRLMYAYPSNFTDEIIDAFAKLVDEGILLPYIDIPLQHGSDAMLTAMRRGVSAQHQLTLCEKLRERIPGMAIRTTFITGFPGETEQDHEALLEFIDAVGFDAVGCFQYSREEGTVAGRMETDPKLAVPAEVKQRRHDEIMELQQRIAFEQTAYLAEQFDPDKPTETGCRFDVLIDRAAGEGSMAQGRTYFQAPQIDPITHVESVEPLAPGELVRCVIVGSDGYDLIARPIDQLERRVSLPLA